MPEWFNLSPRDMLQKIGMSFRENLHEDVWVKLLEKQYLKKKKHVVITDVRFPNEVSMVQKHGLMIAVKRPNYNGDSHESEHALDDHVFRYVFDNSGSEEALYGKVFNFFKSKI
jgi:hypothetical protein